MCGNGARCSALYYFGNSKAKNISVETGAGLLQAEKCGADTIKIKMTDPHSFETDVHLDVSGVKYIINYINTGVPHAVVFSNDVENLDVKNLGANIRYHNKFSPQGSNVDFVKILDKNSIQIRTYERGVEDETLACGTGSVAAALIYGNEGPEINFKRAINVHTRSGEVLKVYFSFKNNKFYDVWLEGKAKLVYRGILS
jgi:diaminopimelate epimerase